MQDFFFVQQSEAVQYGPDGLALSKEESEFLNNLSNMGHCAGDAPDAEDGDDFGCVSISQGSSSPAVCTSCKFYELEFYFFCVPPLVAYPSGVITRLKAALPRITKLKGRQA